MRTLRDRIANPGEYTGHKKNIASPVPDVGKETVLYVTQPHRDNNKTAEMASSQFYIHVATSIDEGRDWAAAHQFDTLLVSSSFREHEVSRKSLAAHELCVCRSLRSLLQ